MDVSSSQASTLAREEERYSQFREQRKAQQDTETSTAEAEHKKRMDSLSDTQKKQLDDQEKAYKVELTHLTELGEKRLDEVRKSYTAELAQEKDNESKEFEKTSRARTHPRGNLQKKPRRSDSKITRQVSSGDRRDEPQLQKYLTPEIKIFR